MKNNGKRMIILINLFLLMIIVIGCNNTKSDEVYKLGEFILNQEKIMRIEIEKFHEEGPHPKIKNSSDIIELIKLISEIPVNQLSKKQDIDYMQNGQKLEEKGIYSVSFIDDQELQQGGLIIWPDGNIYVIDIKTMKGTQRTISYLSKSKYPDVYKWIQEKLN